MMKAEECNYYDNGKCNYYSCLVLCADDNGDYPDICGTGMDDYMEMIYEDYEDEEEEEWH